METQESHLQEDGTTRPPVTPDVPKPPGVEEVEVPEIVAEPVDDGSDWRGRISLK